jgi:hypothetical protein
MKNAFILKNSNASFEHYYQSMKKRRGLRHNNTINLSMSIDVSHAKSIHV